MTAYPNKVNTARCPRHSSSWQQRWIEEGEAECRCAAVGHARPSSPEKEGDAKDGTASARVSTVVTKQAFNSSHSHTKAMSRSQQTWPLLCAPIGVLAMRTFDPIFTSKRAASKVLGQSISHDSSTSHSLTRCATDSCLAATSQQVYFCRLVQGRPRV